jgi:hypothetical protein
MDQSPDTRTDASSPDKQATGKLTSEEKQQLEQGAEGEHTIGRPRENATSPETHRKGQHPCAERMK